MTSTKLQEPIKMTDNHEGQEEVITMSFVTDFLQNIPIKYIILKSITFLVLSF